MCFCYEYGRIFVDISFIISEEYMRNVCIPCMLDVGLFLDVLILTVAKHADLQHFQLFLLERRFCCSVEIKEPCNGILRGKFITIVI